MKRYHKTLFFNCVNSLIIVIFLFACIILSLVSFTYGQNIHTTYVQLETKNVSLDGDIGIEEWDDSTKINFSSPTTSEEYILIYLKYNASDKALNGAFIIPDKTPYMSIERPDQIGFLFDTVHSKSNTTQSTDHQIVFTRGQRGEYYQGNNLSDVYYESLYNITRPSHTLPAIDPLSNITFYILPNEMNNTIWQGEFRISFKEIPKIYGFAIAQRDASVNPMGHLQWSFINYPGQNYTQVQIPSTWGNIMFEMAGIPCGENKYNNVKSTTKPVVLCAFANPLSIDDKFNRKISISGFLWDLKNSSRIVHGDIVTNVTDSEGNLMEGPFKMIGQEGIFTYQFSNINLEPGEYQIWVKSLSEGLDMNFDLNVLPHTPTIEELSIQMGQYIALFAGIIGLVTIVPKIKSYFSSRKQRIITSEQLDEINRVYDQTTLQDKEKGLKQLKAKRDLILTMLKKGDISEGQFAMLNQKVSEYMDKIHND
jgi:hypothetical protein